MRSTLVTSLLLATAVAVQARTWKYTLTLSNRVIAPDGFNRSAVVLNGRTPGPILTAYKGDDMIVTVRNRLNDPSLRRSTSVHWHGILQPHTAFDDGPSFVTQCPIGPGYDYSYRVTLSDQAGTFWYHSHLSSQYIDGLRGALIVYDPQDPHDQLYDIDDESTVISLTDWYQSSAEQLGEAWIHNQAPEPVPDSNLFNGIGRYQGGPSVPRAVVTVRKGKRYRFRVINMSAIVPFNFGIEGHSLQVIEADGVSHQPITVSSFEISAGQRYSVVLNANKPVDNYWIAYPSNFRDTTVPSVNKNYNGTEAWAILHYVGAPKREPTRQLFTPDDSQALKEPSLVPLKSPPPVSNADLVIPLQFQPVNPGEVDTKGGANNWTVNGFQYTPPSLPTLLRILSGASNSSDFAPNEDTYVLPLNKTIDVQLIGDSHHPFHLHGHTFQVIQSATGTRNTVNPPIRDTVDTNDATDPSQVVTIRFRTDNPGPWFLHCHKDWHLEAGLAVVFAEDPVGQRNGLHPSKQWQNLCNIYKTLPKDQQ